MSRSPNQGVYAFIVKSRDRIQWTTQTIKGPRRVRRMTPWKGVLYCLTERQARGEVEWRRKTGLTDWAIFHAGKRLP